MCSQRVPLDGTNLWVFPGDVTADRRGGTTQEPWYRMFLGSFDYVDFALVAVGTLLVAYHVVRTSSPFQLEALPAWLYFLSGYSRQGLVGMARVMSHGGEPLAGRRSTA
jgi:hypothetical protein